MTFADGTLLYIYDYRIPNSEVIKNKFFLVLKQIEGELILCSLPSSVPHNGVISSTGCHRDAAIHLDCYAILPNTKVCCDTGYSFPIETYIYGRSVDLVNQIKFNQQYFYRLDYEIKGVLDPNLLDDIKNCLKSSESIRNKFKKLI